MTSTRYPSSIIFDLIVLHLAASDNFTITASQGRFVQFHSFIGTRTNVERSNMRWFPIYLYIDISSLNAMRVAHSLHLYMLLTFLSHFKVNLIWALKRKINVRDRRKVCVLYTQAIFQSCFIFCASYIWFQTLTVGEKNWLTQKKTRQIIYLWYYLG